MRDAISKWTHGEPWRTWVAHAVIALILTALFGWWVGWWVAVFYYAIRECEQIIYAVVDKKPLTPFDNFMDVAAPAVAVAVVVLGVDAVRSML